jgi:hypothetical protein
MVSQTVMDEHLSPELANVLLQGMPEKIRSGLEARAKAMDYPVWAVIEMAFTKCLDRESQDTWMKKRCRLSIVSHAWIEVRG